MRRRQASTGEPQFIPWGAESFSTSGFNWPLCEQSRRFHFGHVLNSLIVDAVAPTEIGFVHSQHAGLWECNLRDDSLVWSGGVYDLFGLERGRSISRDEALSFYSEDSRAKLERLRGYAIRKALGFTLDVEIRDAAVGQRRRMRIIAAPVLEADVTVRLHGFKLLI